MTTSETKRKADNRGAWSGRALATLLLFGPALSAHPAVSVDPTRVTLPMDPGADQRTSLMLSNPGEDAVRVEIAVSTQHTGVVPPPDNWLTAEPSDVVLQPGQNAAVHIRIRAPADARGEYIGKIKLMERATSPGNNRPVQYIPVIAVPVYAAIRGTERYEARIERIGLKSASPLMVEATIDNAGNTHIRPQGVIAIVDRRTKKPVRQMPFNKSDLQDIGWPILPGRKETILSRIPEASPMEKDLPPGDYLFTLSFELPGQQVSSSSEIRVP